MSILIIGSEGAQGKRYQAILNSIGVSFEKSDVNQPKIDPSREFDGYIIATPTDTHATIIRSLLHCKKPVLCEKPITKNIYEMRDLYEEIKRAKTNFSMVYQYRQLVVGTHHSGHSSYNYFRHGNDGLTWDCLQIIGLAKSCISLEESSPRWECQINGQDLCIEQMDNAYVSEVMDWCSGRGFRCLEEIIAIHEKVYRLNLEQASCKTT